jgi:predicted HAD superfamily Cof-like phosphohydrolase
MLTAYDEVEIAFPHVKHPRTRTIYLGAPRNDSMRQEIEMVRAFHEKLQVSETQRLTDVPPGNDESIAHVAAALKELSQDLEKSMQVLPADRRYLRAHLVTEECAEFVEGLAERDEEKALNALADLAYVLFGSSLTFDLPLVAEFHETHASNMTKEKQPEDASKDRVRKKGPNYRPPDTAGVLRKYREKQAREPSAFRRELDAEREERRAKQEAVAKGGNEVYDSAVKVRVETLAECLACRGTGKLLYGDEEAPCETCGATGRVSQELHRQQKNVLFMEHYGRGPAKIDQQ